MKKDPQHYWAQTYIGEKRGGQRKHKHFDYGENKIKLEKALTTGATQKKG